MRLPAILREASPRERALLAAAMALSAGLVIVYVLATRSHGLAGDEPEYHAQGAFFTEGRFWWSEAITGEPHPSAWKAPGYPAWVGFWYSVLGESWVRLTLLQSLLAPVTVLLAWILARRHLGARIALATAFGVAAFPLVWEYFGLMFPEALAVPLTLGVLIVVLDREPTPARIAAAGGLIGLNLLVRPTAFFLLAGVLVAWIVVAGWRRGFLATVAVGVLALVVVAPWTIRNSVVLDGFVPISIQDAAGYGTFNDDAAADPDQPFAWRATPATLAPMLERAATLTEPEFRSELQDAAFDYIAEHPASVPKAIFWNGITRFWDLRAPSSALAEVDFQGRSRSVRAIGLGLYYVMLPLSVIGLWRLRSRRELVLPLVAMALVATVAFTVVAGTRYRAPFEPLIVMLASAAVLLPRREPRRAALWVGREARGAPLRAPSSPGP
jgi:4-amino-4-deoxy-L-arabinose transferase-like glycosyltransferase